MKSWLIFLPPRYPLQFRPRIYYVEISISFKPHLQVLPQRNSIVLVGIGTHLQLNIICNMAGEGKNFLISSQKSSDSSLQVALHPLVLLTISDYITRHTLRNQKGPVVGALLGQQNGREITIEHAFECLLIDVDGETILNKSWFDERLQQSKPTLHFSGY